jgi:hypothetical protein
VPPRVDVSYRINRVNAATSGKKYPFFIKKAKGCLPPAVTDFEDNKTSPMERLFLGVCSNSQMVQQLSLVYPLEMFNRDGLQLRRLKLWL